MNIRIEDNDDVAESIINYIDEKTSNFSDEDYLDILQILVERINELIDAKNNENSQ